MISVFFKITLYIQNIFLKEKQIHYLFTLISVLVVHSASYSWKSQQEIVFCTASWGSIEQELALRIMATNFYTQINNNNVLYIQKNDPLPKPTFQSSKALFALH